MAAFTTLTDQRLLAELQKLVRSDRTLEAQLLSYLGEVDQRRLYLGEACSSMFAYCVEVLHFSEAGAYKRIAAARAAREYPELLEAVRRGELHVTAVRLLAPHLCGENSAALVAMAKYRTAEQIKRLLADLHPKRDVATSVRRVADSAARSAVSPVADRMVNAAPQQRSEPSLLHTGGAESAEPIVSTPHAVRPVTHPGLPSTPKAEPLGGDRYNVRFTAGPETHAQLRELQALMRHQLPSGDLGAILAHAVAVLHKQVRKQKFAECEKPRTKLKTKPVRSSAAEPQGSESEPDLAGSGPDAAERRPYALRRGPQAVAGEPQAVGKESSAVDREPQATGRKRDGVERKPQAATTEPGAAERALQSAGRGIPAAIRRAVVERDGGGCTYVSPAGRRCNTRDFIEFHHEVPWARDRSHHVDNITLRCRAHNQHAADRDFGRKHMDAFRRAEVTDPPNGSANYVAREPGGCVQLQLPVGPVAVG